MLSLIEDKKTDPDSDPALVDQLKVVTFFTTTRCNARCETCVEHEAVETTNDTSTLLKEMAQVMGKIEKYYDFPNEVLEEIAPEWLADVIQVMEKCR